MRGPAKIPEDKPQSPGLFALAGFGVSIAVCVAAGLGAGIYPDDATHRSPLFTLLGLALGVVFAVGLAYVEIKRFF
jgi:hypothetical protein